VLAAVPFPGPEQIAVFCMTGLVVGCGCAVFHGARAARQAAEVGPLAGDRSHAACVALDTELIVLAALAVVIGWDLRASGSRTTSGHCSSRAQLVREEQRVREVLAAASARFFLVSGDSAQAAPVRAAAPHDALVRAGDIASKAVGPAFHH
jgi:predicted exporter